MYATTGKRHFALLNFIRYFSMIDTALAYPQ
jgi:hypothetical protein